MERRDLLTNLQSVLPVAAGPVRLPAGDVGLVVVDVVQGFTRFGALSDEASMAPMVREVDRIARHLDAALGPRLHLLLLRDHHRADVPEPPYPPHCIAGTGEEELDPGIRALAERPGALVLDKDCINGFVGTLHPAGDGTFRSVLRDWVLERDLRSLVLVGDCTDICVSDLAVSLLSARNHGMLTALTPEAGEAYARAVTGFDIIVHAPACATFDLDPDGPLEPRALRHPREIAHHVGLWVAASRGARISTGLET